MCPMIYVIYDLLGNGALHIDFKLSLSLSVFYMDILLCVIRSQTPYFVLMSSNPYYKEQNGTE